MADFGKETLDRLIDLGVAAVGLPSQEDSTLINGKQAVMVPEGFELIQIDPVDPLLPSFITANVRHDTDDSFIQYAKDYKGDDSRLFVERDKATVTAIFDYHSHAHGCVGRLAHKATYPMPWSPQWKRWSGLAAAANGVRQKTFMEFIEENGEDIVNTPNAIDMMEMVGRVSSRKKIDFTSGLRLSDGSVELSYKEEVENSGGSVKTATMPSEITIGIPIFVDGPSYEIKVLIRYEIDEGKLAFKVVLHRAEFMVEDAMKTAVAKIEQETGLRAHWGVVTR